MTRNLWVLGTVAVFGLSAVIAGVGDTRTAVACDETAKAVKTASAVPSCCAKGATSTASVDAKKVHNNMIKSAVVAPGAAPILNVAAFSGMMTASTGSDCDWCPGAMTAAECAALMQASGCASKMETTTASYQGCSKASAAHVASTNHPAVVAGSGCSKSATTASLASNSGCSKSATTASFASNGGCDKSTANAAVVASHSGCEKSTANAAVVASYDGSQSATMMAGGGACCESKSATAAGTKEACDNKAAKTASLKGMVDEMPYAENKRVVLTGAYACGNCTLAKTDGCSPMLKTADGKVYPLLQSARSAELRAKAEGKGSIEVTGNVKKIDGVKYLDVKSYKVI